jgi:hypothetical protein
VNKIIVSNRHKSFFIKGHNDQSKCRIPWRLKFSILKDNRNESRNSNNNFVRCFALATILKTHASID